MLPLVWGLQIEIEPITSNQYGDDTATVVTDQDSFDGIEECISIYERGSGCISIKENQEDCGQDLGLPDLIVQWQDDKLKSLCVWLSPTAYVITDNWQEATDEFEAVLQHWSWRVLFICGLFPCREGSHFG